MNINKILNLGPAHLRDTSPVLIEMIRSVMVHPTGAERNLG